MRKLTLAFVLALGGCGSIESYESARSMPEMFYHFHKESGLLSEKAVGKNPYDFDPEYRMVYCARGGMQYWSTEATCLEEKGEPQG